MIFSNKKKKRGKKPIKAYLSSKGNRKIDYQRALLSRYYIVFADSLEKSDYLIIPYSDKDGLSEEQRRDLERAEKLGLSNRMVSSELLLDDAIEDPLDIDREERESRDLRDDEEREKEKSFVKNERGFELER